MTCLCSVPREARRPVGARLFHEPCSSPDPESRNKQGPLLVGPGGHGHLSCWMVALLSVQSFSLSPAPLSPIWVPSLLPTSRTSEHSGFSSWLLPQTLPSWGVGKRFASESRVILGPLLLAKRQLAGQTHVKTQLRGKKNQGVPFPVHYLEPNQRKIYYLSEYRHFKIPNKSLPGLQ